MMQQQNKYTYKQFDHGTKDTKVTASDEAAERFPELSPEEGRRMVVLEREHEQEVEAIGRHKLERDDERTLQEEIADGIDEYEEMRELQQSVGAIAISAAEGAAEDITVHQR